MKLIRKIHFWLGITTGPIVFIVALTGCIYAFQEEIQDANQAFRFIDPKSNTSPLPPSQLKTIAQAALPGKHLHAILYDRKDRAAQAIFFAPEQYYFKIYLHPTTGKIQKIHDVQNSFFAWVLDGHFYLWLPPAIGQPVIASSTLIFLLLIISGLYLWWPRNKNNKRQRFSIKWKAKWRRRNYDLHSVMGFYVLIFAFVFATTGLIWGFSWFKESVYFAFSGGKQTVDYYEPTSEIPKEQLLSPVQPVDQIWYKMLQEYPSADQIEIHLPETKTAGIAANANPDATTYWKIDYRYFDQYSLKEKKVSHQWGRFTQASVADKMLRMNYDLHVGAIAGITGKILAFGISLIIASLPISGFLIWFGRRKKDHLKTKRTN